MGAGASIGGDIQDNGYLVIARAGVAACRSRQDVVSRRAADGCHIGPLRPHTVLAANAARTHMTPPLRPPEIFASYRGRFPQATRGKSHLFDGSTAHTLAPSQAGDRGKRF